MQLRRIHRRLAVIALGLSAAGLVLTPPVRAQEPTQQTQSGGRMRILIPNLEHPKGVDDGFGKTVVDNLRKSIDKLPTHVSVSKDEVKDQLRKFHIDEKDLDCIKARQLAVQIGAELVMCGSYEPAAGGQMKLGASFIGAKNGETFEVPSFTAATPVDAANGIYSSFDKYVAQLRALAICQQYLGSQQWSNALQNCNQALAVNPNSPRALYYKGTALMSMDSLPQALDAYRQVIKVNPMDAEAMRAAGVVAAKMDSSALSTSFFKQYLELNPGAADVCVNLANDAAKAGNPEGALQMVEGCMKADTTGSSSKNPMLKLFAGHWALQASQKYEKKAGDEKKDPRADSLALVALANYQQHIQMRGDSADPTVVKNAILIETAQKQAPQAVQLAQKYLALRHDDPGLWVGLADALHTQNQDAQALAALDSAAAYDKKGDYNVAAKRGQWLLENGQLGPAVAAFRQAMQAGKLKSEDAAQLVIGVGLRDHMGKGDTEGALRYLAAGKELADDAYNKAFANFFTGQILFTRASAAMTAASKVKEATAQRKAVLAAAEKLREAGTYLNQSDAYVAKNPRQRAQLDQMLGYIKTTLDYLKKQNSGQ